MRFSRQVCRLAFLFLIFTLSFVALYGQIPGVRAVAVAVVDENGAAVPDAQIVIEEPGRPVVRVTSDFAGHVSLTIQGSQPYSLRIGKPGFYETVTTGIDPELREIHVVLDHLHTHKPRGRPLGQATPHVHFHFTPTLQSESRTIRVEEGRRVLF